MRLKVSLAAVIAVLVVSCGGSPDDVAEFATIQRGSVTFDFDTSATTATLNVETTVGAVCAVAFGTRQTSAASPPIATWLGAPIPTTVRS